MNNLKTRDQFLMEKLEVSLITEAGIQNNNAKWSETMIGKLFGFVFRVVTLNGYLVDKFKDAFGAKSFIIKNLSRRLEKTIDKLPGEYVKRNEEIDNKNLEMQFYDELLTLVDMMNKSKDTPIGKIYKQLEESINNFNDFLLELDPKEIEQSKLILEIKNNLKIIENIFSKVKEITNTLSSEDLESKTGYDMSKYGDKIGDKIEIKRKVEGLKAELMSTVKKGKDSVKLSTESMFKIVSILNKARSIYMEEDREGETVYRGNKRETVFKPNRRLFDLWEEKVLKILGRKSSIIPNNLLAYINNSLASVDPVKYNFEVSPGVERNVLDELSDVDRAMGKVDKKFGKSSSLDSNNEVIPNGKSTSKTMYFKELNAVKINKEDLVSGILQIKVNNGILELYKNDNNYEENFDKSLFFIPLRSYVNGMILGISSYNMEVFKSLVSTGNGKVGDNDFSLNSNDFYTKEAGYKYTILNDKNINHNSNLILKTFDPSLKNGLDKYLDDSKLIDVITIHGIDEISVLYGSDHKIVSIQNNSLKNSFNLNSFTYKKISHYFESNKF